MHMHTDYGGKTIFIFENSMLACYCCSSSTCVAFNFLDQCHFKNDNAIASNSEVIAVVPIHGIVRPFLFTFPFHLYHIKLIFNS